MSTSVKEYENSHTSGAYATDFLRFFRKKQMKNIALNQWIALGFMALLLAAASLDVAAQERSSTSRQSDLKAAPAANARTLTSLPLNTEILIIGRDGGWVRVRAGGQDGWIPSSNLKQNVTVIEQSAPTGGFLSWFSSVLRTDRPQVTARRAQTATIGIRGMDDGSVTVAKLNPEELQRLKLYGLSRNDAEEFARSGELAAQDIAYLDANGQPESRTR